MGSVVFGGWDKRFICLGVERIGVKLCKRNLEREIGAVRILEIYIQISVRVDKIKLCVCPKMYSMYFYIYPYL